VYRVDCLTRSLADFAKLVELFDAHGVSFVSVTQQFNTTTSMGRLTLNVLLSLAQFEREVTSERIRDKIAASKRKLTDQWTTQSTTRNASAHLLTGLLFDDAGHRMVPTHATKAGIRYRYYVSLPHLHGKSKIASVGSVSRIPATDIEDIVVKSIDEHLIARRGPPASGAANVGDRKLVIERSARIDVHVDRLILRLKCVDGEEASAAADENVISIPWQKPPSRRSRRILVPRGVAKSDVRPTRIERRARLVSASARGRRWLDEIVSGSVTDVQQIAARQKCSVRQVNMTISLAFLAPHLVRAAVEGRLPRGIGVERLRDSPAEWSRQFEALGLSPQ
jgi:hypothetical protein